MGISGGTMTLLSTLAALVIIVHTAEEEYERAQGGLRARSLDLDTSNYDKAWRASELDPILIAPLEQTYNSSPDGGTKYRRSRHKRKRRPTTSDDDFVTHERQYRGDIRPHTHQYFINHPDLRGKIDENMRIEHRNGGRRQTRYGHRRKKPKLAENRPRLSEFDDIRSDDVRENNENASVDDASEVNDKSIVDRHDETHFSTEETSNDRSTESTRYIGKINRAQTHNDKSINSMSEFSFETHQKPELTMAKRPIRQQVTKHTTPVSKEKEKAREKGNQPIDPSTLKAILKRSNGKSLSEILQQNNLSLHDLLQGKEEAVSKLITNRQMDNYKQLHEETPDSVIHLEENTEPTSVIENETESILVGQSDEMEEKKDNTRYEDIEFITTTTISVTDDLEELGIKEKDEVIEILTTSMPKHTTEEIDYDTFFKPTTRRRYPFKPRRKIRRRPLNAIGYKGQLSRDFMALTSNKNTTTEWMELLPSNVKTRMDEPSVHWSSSQENSTSLDLTQPISAQEQYSITDHDVSISPTKNSSELLIKTTQDTSNTIFSESELNITNTTTSLIDQVDIIQTTPLTEEKASTTSEKSTTLDDSKTTRTTINSYNSRRQALGNRLKKKRMKQKNSSNESTSDIPIQDISGIANVIPVSDFITKSQSPSDEEKISLPSTLTTNLYTKSVVNNYRTTKFSKMKTTTTATKPPTTIRENTAKYEIEEILNDTETNARLSKILMERNMTLNELVQHRERGSSHVHLADIFHNASKEPNPPEPFLSKSFIEPISKETYPLRAILDANLHDSKASGIDANILHENFPNIPVVMNYGNNVNENGENMGIMSLFNNITQNKELHDRKSSSNDKMNTNEDQTLMNLHNESREGRHLKSDKDLVTWNDIFELVRRNRTQSADPEILKPRHLAKSEILEKILLEEDAKSDGAIVLEDLQHMKDNNAASSSEENVEVKLLENIETKNPPTTNTSSHVKSVTVVTASIIGLGLVLFLLTYTAFKWKQQSKILETKNCVHEERIPSPVFENRQGKNNSSTRSKSPMLSSNIYAIDSIDPHHGAESPEYMWDSLRKPFQ
ncbi:uncharacterized protein LOC126974062 [Leptidea sinapis]|uniref:uncharacterized protein LOC126974062 n=1 Tax=Leptidea sinapis TaxID=189913 RepID=UPI00213181ED|nr:uncharacterized protein LOC126974062 [Leptidea sinapis]